MSTPSENDGTRYARNLLIDGFGEAGQERLTNAKVLIAGLGGLGSPVAYYLAAAGVGSLGLLDPNTVKLSNLQRQILHTTARVGRPKAESAAVALAGLNPEVGLRLHVDRITAQNAASLIGAYDLVVEACDTFAAKFLINDVCVDLGKPFVTAGVLGLSGQVMFVVPGRTACLRCAIPDEPQAADPTADDGVLGAAAGVVGSIQALEVIRWLVGLWTPPPDGAGLLHRLDGDTVRLATVRIPRRRNCRCANSWSRQ